MRRVIHRQCPLDTARRPCGFGAFPGSTPSTKTDTACGRVTCDVPATVTPQAAEGAAVIHRPSSLEVPSFIGQSDRAVAASTPSSGRSVSSWRSRAEAVLSQSRAVLQSESAVALRDAVVAFDDAASHFDEAHPTDTARDAAVNASTALLERAEACGVARRAPCKTAADSPTVARDDSSPQQRWELVVDAVVTVAPPDAAVAAVEQRLANADSASASLDFDLHAAIAALEDTFGDVPPTNSAPSAEAAPQQTEASAGSGHTRSALCHLRDAVTHAAMIVEHHGHAAGDAGKAWRRRVLEETSAASVGLLDRQAAVAVALADLDRSTQLERRGLTDAAVLTAGVAKRPSVAEATAAYDTAVTALHRAEAGAVTASASLRSVLRHYPQDEAALRLLGTAGDLELGRQWLHWADHGRSIAGGYAVLGGGERRTLGSPGSPPLLPVVPSPSTTDDATRARTLSDERIKMPQKAEISAEFDDTAAFAARDSVVRLVKARRLSDDVTVVLRCYPLDAPRTMCDVQRVMKLLRRVHAIHGPRLRGPGTETVLLPTSGFVDALQNVVVLEFPYCPGGALDGARMSAALSTMALDDVCRVCERLLAAVAGLHECGVHHGDLTPGNLLFWDATTPCIGDVCDTLTFARTTTIARATPGYLPPEVLEAFVFNAKPSEWTERASLAGNESMEADNSVDMYRNAVVDSYQTGMLLSSILHKAGLDSSSGFVRQGDGSGSPQEARVQGSDEDPHRPADQECDPAATPKRKTRFGAQRDRVVKAIAATAAEMTARDPQARLSSFADALRRVREAMSVSATVVDAQRSAVLPPRYWVNRVASLGAPTGTAPSSASKPAGDLDLAAAATSVEQVLGHGDHGAAKGRAFIAAAAGRSLHESSYGLAKLRPLFEAAMPGVRVTSVHRNEDHAQWTVYAAERQRLVHRCAARGVDIALPPALASTTFGRTVGGTLYSDTGAATVDGSKSRSNSHAGANEDYAFVLSDALVTPLQRRCNEAFLLHGTTLPLGRLIASRGFDPSRSGERVGARFGQGTYFTPSLWKALGYALPVSTDVGSHAPADGAAVEQGVVLVSRVALGHVVDVGPCAPHMATWRRPPMCAVSASSFDGSSSAADDVGTTEDEYDAVLGDNGRRGAVCVVYRHTRAFPEYVVRVEFDPSA